MSEEFYLTLRWDPNNSGQSGPMINGNEGIVYIL